MSERPGDAAGRAHGRGPNGHVMVFAPAPLLTVTIEQRSGAPDIHLHAGGQGVWEARMAASLGVRTVLCAGLGGETGQVLRALIDDEGIEVQGVFGDFRNGAYVHDRRGGERVTVAQAPGDPLTRHVLDELYGQALAEGLRAGVALLSGPGDPRILPPQVYRRLAGDLGRNGVLVVADLSGEYLAEALRGGLHLVKVSHEELIADGRAAGDERDDLVTAMCELRAAGAGAVVVTRAERPALALIGPTVYEVVMPRLEPADPRGAGDSLTAGMAAGLARGAGVGAAVRIGAAAGSLNVTRHGLGTGRGDLVGELTGRIRLVPVGTAGGQPAPPGETRAVAATPEELAERVRRP